jgi:hypothetical protein
MAEPPVTGVSLTTVNSQLHQLWADMAKITRGSNFAMQEYEPKNLLGLVERNLKRP